VQKRSLAERASRMVRRCDDGFSMGILRSPAGECEAGRRKTSTCGGRCSDPWTRRRPSGSAPRADPPSAAWDSGPPAREWEVEEIELVVLGSASRTRIRRGISGWQRPGA
jgi:hypothetical protein